MTARAVLDICPAIAAALRENRPVVALESTLIAHGLPWPLNLETARAAEAVIRGEEAIPATIAIWRGRPTIGLSEAEIEELAQSKDILKASRRDLAAAVAQERTAATTVAATIYLAHQAGIRLFATGGIGGAHRGDARAWDISADLMELSRTPVCVVCAGAKSILDVPRTLEILESYSVPVVGYGTDEFPAFCERSSGEPVSGRVETPEEAAALVAAHWSLNGAGVVLAQPVPEAVALRAEDLTGVLCRAEEAAIRAGIRGPALTPFLLGQLAELTAGKTLRANQALVIENARLAARIAVSLVPGRAGSAL